MNRPELNRCHYTVVLGLQPNSKLYLVRHLAAFLLVVMPLTYTSFFLLLVVMPGASSGFLLLYKTFFLLVFSLFLIAMASTLVAMAPNLIAMPMVRSATILARALPGVLEVQKGIKSPPTSLGWRPSLLGKAEE